MEVVEVDDGGVNVLQVDDFGLLVTVLMQDGIRTYEKKNSNAHDERTKDLQPIRVQIPAGTSIQPIRVQITLDTFTQD